MNAILTRHLTRQYNTTLAVNDLELQTHVLQSLSRTIVYNLLALITGFAIGCRHIAGARQGFMVYFSHVIHGKFDGSNEKTSIAVRVLQAISGNTTSAPELAMKRCGR